METRRAAHPTPDVLKAFGLSKLDEASTGVVLAHLEGCADCRQLVAAQSGDDFLQRLRQTRAPRSTVAPAKTFAGVVPGPKPPAGQTAIPNLPPELAANPQYEILRELGRGGMGVVYLAKNKLMDRLEVLKVVNKALLDHPGAVERFLREIRSAAKLSHANVVGAYSAMQVGEVLAFAMEYVEGEDLDALVKSNGPLPVAHACFYVQQAALGLQHAFEKKMVHRDIKPQNLMLAREGRKHTVKVLDFGLAKATREKTDDTGLTGEGAMLGTPDYIAPEQTLDAAKADIRADIYSLGCTLYYLLTGRPPFSASSLGAILLAHQMKEAQSLSVVRSEVPEELAAVVRKMMAKALAQRYQTPIEVVQALSPFVKQGPPGKAAKTLPSVPAPVTMGRTDAEKSLLRAQTIMLAPAAAQATMLGGDAASRAIVPVEVLQTESGHEPHPATTRRMWLIGAAVAGVLLFGLIGGLIGLWASGVFKVKTKDGTIVLENVPTDAEVLVDGETVTVKGGDGKTVTIGIAAGKKHQLQVKREGFKVFGQEVEIDAGGRRTIVVRLEPRPAPDKPTVDSQPVADKPAADPSPAPDKPAPTTEDVAEEKGFKSLFNGRDLTGWKTQPTQPSNWRVEKGVLIGSGPSFSHLFTERDDFTDFHLRVEARINNGGNSGVHFRSEFGPRFPTGYEAQINSTHRDVNKTGSLYVAPGGILVSVRETPVPPGQWFMLEVMAEGNHLVIKVNGKTTTDSTDYQRRFISGRLALQQHDPQTIAEFRKIAIKELSPAKPSPPAPATTETKGFVPLFNGKNLAGWRVDGGPPGQWSVAGDTIVGRSRNFSTRNYLLTDKDYADFALRFDFKVENGSHGGVALRAIVGEKMPLNKGLIFDHPIIKLTNPAKAAAEPTGTAHWLRSADANVRPVEVLALPTGVWHSMEVVVRGDTCTATVGGKELVNLTLDPDLRNSGAFTPGLGRRNGKVGFQINTGIVRYRKIEIEELKAK